MLDNIRSYHNFGLRLDKFVKFSSAKYVFTVNSPNFPAAKVSLHMIHFITLELKLLTYVLQCNIILFLTYEIKGIKPFLTCCAHCCHGFPVKQISKIVFIANVLEYE